VFLALALLSRGDAVRVARPSPLRGGHIVTISSRVAAPRAASLVHMSSPERETKKRSSRLATIDRVKPDTETSAKEKVENEPIWRVLLHNDDVHTFDYVSMSIVKVVKTVSRKKAYKITIECHMSGIATVTTTWKQQAKSYCMGLQKMGLTSSIAPDPSMSQ